MLNRSNTAYARKSTGRVCTDPIGTNGTPAMAVSLLSAVAAAGFAATLTWQAGGGVLLSLLAYSLTGSLTLVAAALAIAAMPRRPGLASLRFLRRRNAPATAFPS